MIVSWISEHGMIDLGVIHHPIHPLIQCPDHPLHVLQFLSKPPEKVGAYPIIGDGMYHLSLGIHGHLGVWNDSLNDLAYPILQTELGRGCLDSALDGNLSEMPKLDNALGIILNGSILLDHEIPYTLQIKHPF